MFAAVPATLSPQQRDVVDFDVCHIMMYIMMA
jgi:hypothetical protein